MSTQKRKFELYQRLQGLGFTYEEAAQLRRIEMTLHRWAEMECGDESGRAIERDEKTGKPFMTYDRGANGARGRYAIADREAGAVKRLNAIVAARNHRATFPEGGCRQCIYPYYQGDCRGCMLYLVLGSQLMDEGDKMLPLDQYYTRGLAVCA